MKLGSCRFYSSCLYPKGKSNYKFASIPTFVVQEVQIKSKQKTPKPNAQQKSLLCLKYVKTDAPDSREIANSCIVQENLIINNQRPI